MVSNQMNEVYVAYWLTGHSIPSMSVQIIGVFPSMELGKRYCEMELGQGPPTFAPLNWSGSEDRQMAHYPNGPVFVERKKYHNDEHAWFAI